MKNKIKKNNPTKTTSEKLSPFSIIVLALMVATGILFVDHRKSEALSTDLIATLIGGHTEGIEDICCNALIISFTRIPLLSIYIVDGKVMYGPSSKGYQNDNELSEGYCALGTLSTSFCLDPVQECESGELMKEVDLVGTSGLECDGAGAVGGLLGA